MRAELTPLSEISKLPRNAKGHDLSGIANSFTRFGFIERVVVNELTGHLLSGHGRVEVLEQRKAMGENPPEGVIAKGLNWLVPVDYVSIPESEEEAASIALNRLVEKGGWCDEELAIILKDLDKQDKLDGTGYDKTDLYKLLEKVGYDDRESGGNEEPDPQVDVDKAEELRKKYGVESGQLWGLGDHRLICGDSTDNAVVERVMKGETCGLCFTSPPYMQQRDYTNIIDNWDGLMQGVFGNVPANETTQVLVNLGLIYRDSEWVPYWDEWIKWMGKQGWRRAGWYVWDQGWGMAGDWASRFAPSHEWVFHFNKSSVRPSKWVDKKPESIAIWHSTKRQKDGKLKPFDNPMASLQPTKIPDSVIRVGRQRGSDGHPAQFPIGFPIFMMRSWPGTVYDPFLGSGTTLVAAEQLGRKCRAIEISPAYCAITIERWANMTGKEPQLIEG